MMHIAGSIRPQNDLDTLEHRRDRLSELVELGLVSPVLSEQLAKAVDELNGQIAAARAAQWNAPFALAA